MKKSFLIIAGLLFAALLALLALNMGGSFIETKQILDRNTPLKEIVEHPKEYLGTEVQTHGLYMTAPKSSSPDGYALVGEENVLYTTDCNRPDMLGAEVYVVGDLVNMSYTGLKSPSEIMEDDEDYNDIADVEKNVTSIVLRCKEILN